jgi:hypothetical protein
MKSWRRWSVRKICEIQGGAAAFKFDKGPILTRTLAGSAALRLPRVALERKRLFLSFGRRQRAGMPPGKKLRGYVRTEADYDQLRSMIAGMAPDVIALQEIGSIPAAEAVLGDGYAIQFETRCITNEKQCQRVDLESLKDTLKVLAVGNGGANVVPFENIAPSPSSAWRFHALT